MNEAFTGLLAFGVVFLTAGFMIALSILRRKTPPTIREIPAYTRLRRAVGRVVEDGSRLHVSLGRSAMVTPQGASALAGLALLGRLAELTSGGDKPPIATTGDASVAILAQSILQDAAESSNQSFDPSAGRLTGLTPFSYAAGAIPSIRDENVSAAVLMGNFGVEAALLTDAAERSQVFNLAASDNLEAQAVLYATAQQPVIGEELFAAGAYFDLGSMHHASVTVQDILRFIFIAAMLIGALLKLAGIL